MKAILIEPKGSYKHVPVGLLKIAAYLSKNGHTVYLHRCNEKGYTSVGHFDRAYVTSLFTWEWREVWEAVRWAKLHADKVILGGIYASALPEHAEKSGAKVHRGLLWELEDIRPLYELVPNCDYSIVHASRGCIRSCKFCIVPKIEGKLKEKKSIRHLVHPKHHKIILYDNNILALKNWNNIYKELRIMNKLVDFNQGIDVRLIDQKIASQISKLRLHADEYISVRIAFDDIRYKKHFIRGAEYLLDAGIHPRRIMVYVLYNFKDTPEDFFERIRIISSYGMVAFPMRYQHIYLPEALEKDSYVGEHWTKRDLAIVEDFIWKYGRGGSIPPYIYEHFEKSKDFYEAFAGTLHNTKITDFISVG